MQIIKYIMLFLIFISANLIGRFIAKKYIDRLDELEEMKNSLNIFKAKVKFTYEPIPEIFDEISNNSKKNISDIFKIAKYKMNNMSAEQAWKEAVNESNNNLIKEDKEVLKMLSKMLGQTDVEGQISQVEITESFLETQIQQAQDEKIRNEKLFTRLGTTIGLVIVIILI